MNSIVRHSGGKKAAGLRTVVSVEALAVLTSIHHLDELGVSFLVPALLIVGLPLVLMWWYLKKFSQAALWTYSTFVALVILGFGVSDGLWNHTIKLIVFL